MLAWLSEIIGASLLAALVAALPSADVDCARRRGERLALALWRIDRRWRPLAETQVRRALPAVDATAIVRATYTHYGRMLGELAAYRSVLNRPELFSASGEEHSAVLRPRGGLIVTAHLGNWELMGHDYARRFGRLTALVKPIENRRVERWIDGIRRESGIDPLITRDNALTVKKRLRGGHTVVVLLDQNSLNHEGVFVPFFGDLASTHYGPAMLAIEARVPVLTAFSHRTPDGRFHLDWDEPLDVPADGGLRQRTWELTRRLSERIEAAVRRHPEQWFWVHKRWKNRPGPAGQMPAWKLGPAGEAAVPR